MSVDELKSLLSRFNIKPSKKLGQNFLLNEDVLDSMAEAAELTKDDTVLEVGPGLGVLTRKLSERAGLVLAVEKDRKLVKALRKLFKSKKNVKIIQGDILFLNPTDYGLRSTDYKVVANIPYYLTGKLLQNFLQPNPNLRTENPNDTNSSPSSDYRPSLMVLLLQKEVAQRITARPGGHSVLSITTQFYAEPEIITYVSKEDFYPVPEVDSAAVRVRVRKSPRFSVNDRKFFQLVKIGFSSKRKQLHNNLSAVFKNDIKQTLIGLGIDPKVRAEDLSLNQWYKLYKLLFS